ncbi:hypothetical protein Q8F55_004412 [Vanrija albida]|uniref:Golgi apparatus membrane protein TVP38 n=1 Tax=Vanrija albida TaxID=181172 RepID=A0ABR3Q7B4_9TREE
MGLPSILSSTTRLRPAFLRRDTDGSPRRRASVDLEAQTPPISATPEPVAVGESTAIDEKAGAAVHFADPPAYDTTVSEKEVARSTIASSTRPEATAPTTPTTEEPAALETTTLEVPCTNPNQPPTVMVLLKEDYKWARAYLKDMDYKVALRRALRRHLYKWYALAIIIITISALVSAKHTTIVNFCQPVTRRIREWPAGWLIPIVLLVIVSFPPLVGHEIIGILCGLVWGLGEGFGILCAGTFFGELATWVAFKWWCTARAQKFEKKNRLYASLTQLIREKSFTFVLILRFSAVPGHIVTAVSASAGAHFGSYCAAALLTLPKQFVIVYLGMSFGHHNPRDTIISWCATIATFIGTIIAAVYIYLQMRLVYIRKNSESQLPLADPHAPGSPSWADLEVHGVRGVGAGARIDIEGRQSVDVIIGPHARRPWIEAQQRQEQLRRARLAAQSGPRTPARTRSLPGNITENEMRDWLSQLDTALMTTAGHPEVRVIEPPVHHEGHGVEDAELAEEARRPARSRANTGTLEPIPYSQHVLLSPPVAPCRIASPLAMPLTLPDLAVEHIYPHPDEDTSHAKQRPLSGAVPAITLTPTYTPARSRADSLRGTQSLDIERPARFRPSGPEIADEADEYAIAHGARRPDLSRLRGDSRAALLGRQPKDGDDD